MVWAVSLLTMALSRHRLTSPRYALTYSQFIKIWYSLTCPQLNGALPRQRALVCCT